MAQLEAQLTEKNITIQLTDDAREWLAKEGFDPAMGARPLGRVIQEQIKKPLAEEVLFGELIDGGLVKIDVKKDELTFKFEKEKRVLNNPDKNKPNDREMVE